MGLDELRTMIATEVLIVIPALYLIGLVIRQTPHMYSWLDSWINLILGIVFCMFMVGFNVDAVIQGVLVAGAASLMKDLIDRTAQQAPKGGNNDGEGET